MCAASLSIAIVQPAAPGESVETPTWVTTSLVRPARVFEVGAHLGRSRMTGGHAQVGRLDDLAVLVADRFGVYEPFVLDDLAELAGEPHPHGAVGGEDRGGPVAGTVYSGGQALPAAARVNLGFPADAIG